MRLSFVALAALLLAPLASAQSQYADGEGTYLSLGHLKLWGGNGGLSGVEFGGEIGRRLGDGVDVGLIGSYGTYGLRSDEYGTTGWSAGVTAGLTRPAPLGTVARLQGLVAYGSVDGTYPEADAPDLRFDRSSLTGDVSATLGKEIPIIGSVRLQPAVGLYGRAVGTVDIGADDSFEQRPGPRLDAGLQFELPVRFRLFGTDAALVTGIRRSLVPGEVSARSAIPMVGLRINF
ncbi:hypothetical protein [Rubrivirga marina]|uniref:Outer membrane protein beta-barrel domain-containing protein n=1 Tax=Rubrivirga marina TaxID=1196024 RepID=A0A271J5Q1_9BACT|nr:hypothetical protein [Rubrivirga marina]PAP78404.1 hypothetical protein BSZ37_19235 [Rubrivirga marina]